MGYGLAGAIGMSLADKKNKTCLFEGDGGFTQNIQEIGTAVLNKLNLKIFIFYDEGYASIRMTQKNYFQGTYVGCDEKTGLKFPNWIKLFKSYDVPVMRLNKIFYKNKKFLKLFNNNQIAAFIVPIDPEQTYYPKISSKILKSGYIISNSLDKMTPMLNNKIANKLNII
jgi:acetolactate synthase-1/2/3 large subunit